MEQLIRELKNYVDLRFRKLKLTVVEQLSLFFGKAVAMAVFVVLLMLTALALTGAFVAAMYELVGSLALAFVIVGGFFLLVAVVVYLLRNRLFTGGMVRTFCRMFFPERPENEEDDEYEND